MQLHGRETVKCNTGTCTEADTSKLLWDMSAPPTSDLPASQDGCTVADEVASTLNAVSDSFTGVVVATTRDIVVRER